MLGLVEDVLDFSKIEAGKVTIEKGDFDLHALVNSTSRIVAAQASAKGVEFVISIMPEVPPAVRGDPHYLRQILINLAGNAVKFTERGSVTVHVSAQAESEARVQLKFSVRDTGIGIAPEAQARIFDSFTQADQSTTRRFGGTGLGLVITRRIVELMGGQVGVESEVGRGSRFWFTVRLSRGTAPPAPAEAIAPAAPVPPAGDRPLVLVAEDNVLNQTVASRMLEKLGYAVDVAANGKEALAAIARRSYAAVLMDGQMPVMDGYQATRAVRSMESGGRHTPVIALSASVMREDRERCLAAGMDDFIAKPVTPEQLQAVLARWAPLEQARAQPGPPPSGPPPAPPPGPVDWEVLQDVLAVTQPAFIKEMVVAFLSDAREALGELRRARLQRELGSWRRIAHKFRGSCAAVGARGMMDLTTRMEALDEAGLDSRADALRDELEAEFRRVEEALRSERERAGAPFDLDG
jgi:CheY-like chemotaxis protein/HPt (histidine-containing phosphotransfer) domain-containing protein